MLVSATAFQNEAGKYFELVQNEDIYLNLPRLKSQGSWELSPNGKIFTKLSP